MEQHLVQLEENILMILGDKLKVFLLSSLAIISMSKLETAFAGGVDSFENMHRCYCEKPKCTKTVLLQPESHNYHLSELNGISLAEPEKDAERNISNGDYRYLTFGDRKLRFGSKLTEDLYLQCKLGHRVIEGINYGDDIAIIGNDDEVKKYLTLRVQFMEYLIKYNSRILQSVESGGIPNLSFEDRSVYFPSGPVYEKLRWGAE